MNKKYIKIILLLIVLLLSCQWLLASGPRQGTSAATELLIPMGARNVALAGSDIASVKGSGAIYWNPAGIADIKSGDVSFSYMKYFADMDVTYISGALKLGQLGVLGISIQSLNIGELEVTTINTPEGTGEIINPDYLTAGVSYSNKMTDKISFGITGKIISENIGTMSANAFGMDIGLQYHTEFGLDFGITMKNIGTELQFDGTAIEFNSTIPYSNPNSTSRKTKLDMSSAELPSSMNIGLAYKYRLSEMGQINLFGLYSKNGFEVDRMNFGGEFNFKNLLLIRGGYVVNLYPDDWEWDKEYAFGLSYGFGLNLTMGGSKVLFDYAFRPMENFDANQYFSFSVGF